MYKFQILKDQEKEIVIEQPGDYLVELLGAGARAVIKGAFLSKGSEVVEVNLVIHHRAGHTRAETVLHGAARDKSQIIFRGKIVIDKGCPDTNSFLTEKILLLSDGAKTEAVPDLEIESDDVKCSHAATIGRIDEGQIFYLMSRGLSREKAEEVIVEGFLEI